MTSLLTEELRALVGSEVEFLAPEPLGQSMIRYFTQAVDDQNPIYLTEEYARAAGYSSVIAPPTLVCETLQFSTSRPDANGYIGHLWDLPIEGAQLIRGGHEYEFFRPVLPTDRISAKFRIADISDVVTGKGTQMIRVVNEIRYIAEDGSLLAINRETLLYQMPEVRP